MPSLTRLRLLAAGGLAGAMVSGSAGARTLTVGEGKAFPSPSAAIAAAGDGDTVLISPGQYFDCAIVFRTGLVIAGDGDGVVMTDKACEGKALLVIRTDNVTVRNLTLARARVPDGNGAGIRAEGPSLTVEHVTFENDQVGVLSGATGGTIRVSDSRFHDGGVGGDTPKYAVMVGDAALLSVTGSVFAGVGGGQISSSATRTEVRGNTIATGFGEDPAEAVWASDGSLVMADNTITVGPGRPRRDAAVAVWDGATATVQGNRLVNQTGTPIALVEDWSWDALTVEGNTVASGDTAVTSSGVWRHRVSTQLRKRKAETRALAGDIKRFLERHLR